MSVVPGIAGALHHVGVVVPSLAEALPFYRDTLGLACGPERDLPDQAVRVVMCGGPGQRIELLEPTDETSGVGRFLRSRGRAALHHVCFVVDDLAGALDALGRSGIKLIDRAPRPGVAGQVAFIHPDAAGVLVELIDRASLGA